MSEAMTIAGDIEMKLAKLGKDFSNRAAHVVPAVERGDAVYLNSVTELYALEVKDLLERMQSLLVAIQPEVVDADT